jgi:hypothetical protein
MSGCGVGATVPGPGVVMIFTLGGVGALVACAGDHGPRLVAAMPAAAPRGAMVMLTGERLCGGDCTTAAGEVQIGLEPPMVRAIVVSYADTAAEVVIPPVAPIGKTALIVTVDERSSNALDFEVLP